MTDPSVLACHDASHGGTGSTTFPKLHHHGPAGERVGHSRFGSCIWCDRGDDLHGEPTLVRAIRAEMESSEPTPIRADGTPMESSAEAYARLTAEIARNRAEGLYDAEPVFPAQTCPSCGAEHPGQPCAAYDSDLFGGAL